MKRLVYLKLTLELEKDTWPKGNKLKLNQLHKEESHYTTYGKFERLRPISLKVVDITIK